MKCNFKLILFLLIALFPFNLKALEVSTYSELEEAINNATTEEIVLTSDITKETTTGLTIKSNQDIVLDLNGHSVDLTATNTSTSYLFTNNGTLTIRDSSDTKLDGTGTGKLLYTATTTSSIPSYTSSTIINKGTLKVESGYIENDSSGPATYAIDAYSNNSSVIINGGKLYSVYSSAIRQYGDKASSNSLEINGGILSSYTALYLQTSASTYKLTTKITGGLIEGTDTGIYVYDGASTLGNVDIKVTGGTIKGATYGAYLYSVNGKITIDGGTFESPDSYAIYYYTYDNDSKKLILNDGLFDGYIMIYEAHNILPSTLFESAVEINGGKYAGDIYVAYYNGSAWAYSYWSNFINNGYFKYDGNEYWWGLYIKDGVVPTKVMATLPEGFKYTIGYEITLDPNYDNKETANIYTLADGMMAELYDLSRDGYTFLGWNTKADGKGDTVTKDSKITEAKTLYAQWQIIPGNKDVEVKSDDFTDVKVDKDELEELTLTEEDKEKIENGIDVSVELFIKDALDTVTTEDKEKVLNKIKNTKYKLGNYIDISLIKTIGDEDTPIAELEKEIEITLGLPQNLINKDKNITRTYKVVRVHDGKTELLDAKYDSKKQTVKFKTNKFSTYSIVYEDIDNSNNNNVPVIDNPKTVDNILIYVLLFIASLGIIAFLVKKVNN